MAAPTDRRTLDPGVGLPRVDEQFDPSIPCHRPRRHRRQRADRALCPHLASVHRHRGHRRHPEIARRVVELARLVEPAHRVVVRLHDKAMSAARTHPELAARLAPEQLSTNALLGVADTLVTDYSSVFFDYLATGQRLVFWMPDQEVYSRTRGMYLDALPGPVCATADEVAAAIAAPTRAGVMAAARESYAPDDDGHATGRVLDAILALQAGPDPLRSVRGTGSSWAGSPARHRSSGRERRRRR